MEEDDEEVRVETMRYVRIGQKIVARTGQTVGM